MDANTQPTKPLTVEDLSTALKTDMLEKVLSSNQVHAAGVPQLMQLLGHHYDVGLDESGRVQLKNRFTGQPAAADIQAKLSEPNYAHFLTPAAPNPAKNLVEQARIAAGVAPKDAGYVPLGQF